MTFNLPAYSVANSSTIGATIWQGPHHTAQKSTITRPGDLITSVSHPASSTFSAFVPTEPPYDCHAKKWSIPILIYRTPALELITIEEVIVTYRYFHCQPGERTGKPDRHSCNLN